MMLLLRFLLYLFIYVLVVVLIGLFVLPRPWRHNDRNGNND